MIRVVAVLIGIIIGLANSAQACSQNASSTFCADGWMAQPMGRDSADGQDLALDQTGNWTSDGSATDPSYPGDEDIYVEGAVMLDEVSTPDEEPL